MSGPHHPPDWSHKKSKQRATPPGVLSSAQESELVQGGARRNLGVRKNEALPASQASRPLPARGTRSRCPIMAHSFKPGWFPPNLSRLLTVGYWVPRIGRSLQLSQSTGDESSALAVETGLDIFWGIFIVVPWE